MCSVGHLRKPPYSEKASLVPYSNSSSSSSFQQPTSNQQYITLPGHYHVAPTNLSTFLTTNLDVSRLNAIFPLLWFAGRRGNHRIRPLHWHRLVRRSIIITEQADLHLIWYNDQIYIKPLPHFLLSHGFFARYICTSSVYPDACGFLQSYLRLVKYESDYRIAVELGLLPGDVSWAQWSAFAAEVRPVDLMEVSRRYEYGELRLFRLNLIYRVWGGHWVYGYFSLHTNFNSFFGKNFAWPLITFAYVTTVLNAMQVVLGSGRQDRAVEKAFFGVGIGVVIAISGTFFLVAAFFVVLLLYHLRKALRGRRCGGKGDLESQEKSV